MTTRYISRIDAQLLLVFISLGSCRACEHAVNLFILFVLQTVALSQLDSLRRELIACARDRLEFLVFTKVCGACS